jgi:membrane dipeptidase
MGVRLMHLTYNRRNFVGDGCAEEANGGLSALGKDLVKRLNKCGIIVDVPHTGLRSSYEAAKVSEKPIMASHTAARALHDFIRCKDDETLKAIADGGGMVGVFAYPGMLGLSNDINALMDHVEYIAKLVGVDYVGISTDNRYTHNWNVTNELLRGYPNAEFNGNRWWGNWANYPYTNNSGKTLANGSLAWLNWPLFTVALVTRGFKDEEIAKIMGQNFLRVFKANQI